MKRDGLENVHPEKVMVPKWVRGSESAEIVRPARQAVAILGLGGSVATPRDGIEAPLLVVHSFEELEAHADWFEKLGGTVPEALRLQRRLLLSSLKATSSPH